MLKSHITRCGGAGIQIRHFCSPIPCIRPVSTCPRRANPVKIPPEGIRVFNQGYTVTGDCPLQTCPQAVSLGWGPYRQYVEVSMQRMSGAANAAHEVCRPTTKHEEGQARASSTCTALLTVLSADLSQVGPLQKQTLRKGFECKQLT